MLDLMIMACYVLMLVLKTIKSLYHLIYMVVDVQHSLLLCSYRSMVKKAVVFSPLGCFN
jgi:hypothetical protein